MCPRLSHPTPSFPTRRPVNLYPNLYPRPNLGPSWKISSQSTLRTPWPRPSLIFLVRRALWLGDSTMNNTCRRLCASRKLRSQMFARHSWILSTGPIARQLGPKNAPLILKTSAADFAHGRKRVPFVASLELKGFAIAIPANNFSVPLGTRSRPLGGRLSTSICLCRPSRSRGSEATLRV